MRFRKGWFLLVACALVAGACDTDDTAGAVLTTTTTTSTTTTVAVSSSTWSRIPHDEAVFGGAVSQEMLSVTVGGPGLVGVGVDGMGDDADGAVWTSPDGVTWSRVPHDEAVFGGVGNQKMEGVTVGGPGLVAVGWAEPTGTEDAAV